MGCTITIVRPEHKILDWCNEICRLAALSDDQATSCDSSTGSSKCCSSIDQEVTYCCNAISDVAKSCDFLPQYCLREIRHAVETVHFKKPDVFERLSKLCDSTILAVRRKTLGLSSTYSCIYSPNQGELKLDFTKLEDLMPSSSSKQVSPSSPSRTRLISTVPQFVVPAPLPTPDALAQNPSKTPSSTPYTSPRPNSTPPAVSLHKKIDNKRRASCPTPSYQETNTRNRLKSLDENDEATFVDYGFFNDEETRIFDV